MNLTDQTIWRLKRNEEGDPELKGKYGRITVYGGLLDVWVTNTRIALRIEHMGWKAISHYDDGALFLRPFSDLHLAAKTLRCPRKRHLSAEARQKAVARLAEMRSLAQKIRLERTTVVQVSSKGLP